MIGKYLKREIDMETTFNLCEDCEGEFLGPHQTDDGIWRCDGHYIKVLKSELSELQQKIANATCHRGHSDYPLTFWDCPTCAQIEKKILEANKDRLFKRARDLEDALRDQHFHGEGKCTHGTLHLVGDHCKYDLKILNEHTPWEGGDRKALEQEMEMFEKINIELLKSDLSSIANEYKSGQIALDYIVQLEAKLAETTKIGEELIDERDDIIASFKIDNSALREKLTVPVAELIKENTVLQNRIDALQRQVEHLMIQVDKLREKVKSREEDLYFTIHPEEHDELPPKALEAGDDMI